MRYTVRTDWRSDFHWAMFWQGLDLSRPPPALARNWLPRRRRAPSEGSGRLSYDGYNNHRRAGFRTRNYPSRGNWDFPVAASNSYGAVPSARLDSAELAGFPEWTDHFGQLSRESQR